MALPEQTNTTIDFLSLEFTFYSTCLKLSHLPPETLELSCFVFLYKNAKTSCVTHLLLESHEIFMNVFSFSIQIKIKF